MARPVSLGRRLLPRRALLRGLGAGALAFTPAPAPQAARPGGGTHPPVIPIIDTHTHFYDPERPEGIPWPRPGSPLYRRAMPEDYARLARPLGIRGTVVVEAVWRPVDHDWILGVASTTPLVVGVVGRMSEVLGTAEFAERMRQYARSPLFRGLRVGPADVRAALTRREVRLDLGRLGDAGLVLDVNGGPDLLEDVARLAQALPRLPVIIDHLANVSITGGPPPASWMAGIAAAGARPNICCKVSSLAEGSAAKGGGRAPEAVAHCRPVLDAVWNAFGEDRVVFGSNWPVSERAASLATVVGVVREYLAGKGRQAAEKHLWRNSQAVYGWVQRPD